MKKAASDISLNMHGDIEHRLKQQAVLYLVIVIHEGARFGIPVTFLTIKLMLCGINNHENKITQAIAYEKTMPLGAFIAYVDVHLLCKVTKMSEKYCARCHSARPIVSN